MTWHFAAKELPDRSDYVVAVTRREDLFVNVLTLPFSAKHKTFNAYDWYTPKKVANTSMNDVVYVWAWADELFDELEDLANESAAKNT